LPTIAATLGVHEVAGETVLRTLSDFLKDQRLLLLLDNCEHVLDVAPDVATLLATCPTLTILATSRESLHVRGEREFPLPPLPVPAADRLPSLEELARVPAVALFVHLATASRPDFILTASNAAAVAGICRQLDGLPLAIELAAARIKVLPPAALLTRLEKRLPLLTGGGRDLPPRQQTMRDTIAWSYDLLPPDEQALFQRLSVFVGGFTLDAAEAVVGSRGSSDVFTGISVLVESSLLFNDRGAEGEARFRMLETIREFAVERLTASGAEDLIRQAHAEWYLALVETPEAATWGGSAQKPWLVRLDVEFTNLRAALSWFSQKGDAESMARLAASLTGYWHVRSRRVEGRAWLERALTQGLSSDGPKAKALLALGVLEHLTGSQRATDLIEQSMTLSRGVGDTIGTTHALYLLGIDARNRGDFVLAKRLLAESHELAEETGDQKIVAMEKSFSGLVTLGLEGAERAEPVLEEALALFRQQNDAYQVACALLILGWAASDRGDEARAAARYTESLALWLELGTKEGLVDVLSGVAALVGGTRQPERAARLLAAAEALAASVGYVLPVPERTRYDRTRAELRSVLGEAAFTAVWATGLEMPPEEAVAEAKVLLAERLEGMSPNAPRTTRVEGNGTDDRGS
jgi:non-specific serine/threonine protein kinase